ncbi:MAG: 30S ribosome-binding factor RbfA [Verrucomicrobia bacterium]|nr:30S ribosome-binding factor RbfA [Verrucomicrobiota bacterium]
MKQDRMTRVNELLRREIAMALFHIMQEAKFDLAAVTVTHVITSANLRNAKVFVSILGHEQQREGMLSMLRRHRAELQAWINKHVKLKYTPCLTFELDTSIERGDHVLGLLMKMEDANAPAVETPPEGEKPAADDKPDK